MNFAFTLPTNKQASDKVRDAFVYFITKYFPTISIVGIDAPEGEGVDQRNAIGRAVPGSVIVIDSENQYDVDWFISEKHALSHGVKSDFEVKGDEFAFNDAIALNKFLDKFVKKQKSDAENMAQVTYARIGYAAPYADMFQRGKYVSNFVAAIGGMVKKHENEFYSRVGYNVTPKVRLSVAKPSMSAGYARYLNAIAA